MQKGAFKARGAQFNCDPAVDVASQTAIRAFAIQLSKISGKTSSFATPIGIEKSARAGSVKGFAFYKDASLPEGGYTITVGKRSVIVSAAGRDGFLYAIQTLKQLLPVEIYGRKAASDKVSWKIPAVKIQDAPRFGYRGAHLDCCRHFFSVAEVKKYLDVMAIFKLNRFHWHLTEDQGWRIELKRYPELTEIGAFRNGTMVGKDWESDDGVRYGGYYTQEQIKDIVAYADALGITVIPEVDLPGHMVAALATYPELGCGTGPYEVRRKWGVADQVLNVGKEETMVFLENVVSEVADLFPSEYFHIGGDECPKTEWKNNPDCQAKIRELGLKDDERGTAEQHLQNYVTYRMQTFLETKGKKIIGWDEILEGKLEPGATVMSWRGAKGGIAAANAGFDVIMTPNSHCYLDYYQAKDKKSEPLAIGGYLPVEKVYSLEPTDEISEENKHHVLGAQVNLWTEYIASPQHLEYMLLPRLLALSEVAWCQPEIKDFDRFKTTVISHEFPILDLLGYSYCLEIEK
ncbi:MAG: beta-N-acetylhexosaminidase [Bacteroidales bacterium]|nr:beta-N-acetylhexosaminidase [Bacteroidales bacterium]